MGWATYVTGEVMFNRQTYNNKYEVEDAISEQEEMLDFAKDTIKMLCSGNVKELLKTTDCGDNECDAVDVLQIKLKELFGIIEDTTIEIFKLNFLLENWDNRDGDFVENPKLNKTETETETNQK